MSSSRALRTLRGGAAATTATFTALFSHVAGGGEIPGVLGVLTPLVLSVLLCTAFTGRRRSLLRLSLSVVVSQLLFSTAVRFRTCPQAALASSAGRSSDSGPARASRRATSAGRRQEGRR